MPMARADPLGDEIAHLIGFVRTASCTFIRTGRDPAAVKPPTISGRSTNTSRMIHTVEDFSDRAASNSLRTGKPYEVRC
jgi:hypothetical protein